MTEPRKSWLAQAIGIAAMLAVLALAFALRYWVYLPAA
jgi:hypothetical protein